MSQELNYKRVATVREAQQFQRNFGPIIAQVLNSAPVEVEETAPTGTQNPRPAEDKVSDTDLSDNSEDDTPNDGGVIW